MHPILSSSVCEGCMLDPNCGFCYNENATTVYNSSCVPVNPASTDHAAWGRSDAKTQSICGQIHTQGSNQFLCCFIDKMVIKCISTSFNLKRFYLGALCLMQMFQPDRCSQQPSVGLQLLSNVLLLDRPAGSHPLPCLLRSRSRISFLSL